MVSSHGANREAIEKLISSLADDEPAFSSHGTPFLVDTETTQSLVQMGKAAVPALVETLNAENPKLAMYAAYCLGLIGDQSVLSALRRTKEKYIASEPKREYDYGVISAVSRAEEKLMGSDE